MMTSRERVLAAYGHREPDRVPLNYQANPEIDMALKKALGIDPGDHPGLADALSVDFRGCYVRYEGPQLHKAPESMRVTEWGARTRWVEHSASGYWDFCEFPLAGNISVDDVDNWPMPDPDEYDYGWMRDYCTANRDFPLVLGGAGVGCILNRVGQLRGMANVLCNVVTGDVADMRLVERLHEIDLAIAQRALAAVGDQADIFSIGKDLGTQQGSIMPPQVFRTVIQPRTQMFIDAAKKYDLLVMFHSCGSSSWAFNNLIDMGVDIIDTLQPEAAEMDPTELKRAYGDRLAFHGMISTAGALSFGTPGEVRDEVKRILDVMMPGGGYALAPTHMIQSNAPVDNVLAMYDTAREYGVY